MAKKLIGLEKVIGDREIAEQERIAVITDLDGAVSNVIRNSRPVDIRKDSKDFQIPHEELQGYQADIHVSDMQLPGQTVGERMVMLEIKKQGTDDVVSIVYDLHLIKEGDRERFAVRSSSVNFGGLTFHPDDDQKDMVNAKIHQIADRFTQWFEDHSETGRIIKKDRETVNRLMNF